MKNTAWILVSTALLVLSCAKKSETPAPAAAAPAANAEFTKFVDDYFAAQFAYGPTGAVASGFHEYDGQIEDRSQARIDARAVELKALLARLAAIDRGKLTFDEAIDADALDGQIRGELLDLEVIRVYNTNPMFYAYLPGGAVDILMKRDFAPAPERLRSMVARMQKIPAIYDACRANVQNPPKEFTDIAIRLARGSAGFFEGSVAEWAKGAAGSDAALAASFAEANGKVIQATKDFALWLEKDLKPRSKGAYAIGAENFAAKLKHEEMVDMPLAELLAKGEAQLEKDHAAFVATAKAIDPTKTPSQVHQSLSANHPSADELVSSVAESVEDARRYLVEKDLVTIPSEVRPKIQETPPYARSGGYASMDTPGPYETKATEAFYYVTPVEKEWSAKAKEEHLKLFNPYVASDINVHEAWPGHYLQFLWAPKFKTKTRKLVACGTNAEGWAHYAEQMMIDQGFHGDDPRYKLAQLQEALLRDCRYVVGIKLHTQGMSVEDGGKVFVDRCFQEPSVGYEESRRGAYNPTYLYYTLGKIEIMELAREYQEKKGATLKQFHDAFVSEGALPIPLVRRIMFR
jgi:uncharacterized protein (DUF885 family)